MKPVTVLPVDAKRYRPDIDGLRAIAVLVVVFFHFDVEIFSGGFIGVDVFFVISGFLITRLIIAAVGEGSFTYGGFYLRRVRRLGPALLFTIATCFILGYFLFSPQHFQRLGGSSLHGLLSLSNFFFWNESGYFDAVSSVKPLLHLWSLSVEEQFYLIWPFTLVLLQKVSFSRISTPLVILLLGAASWVFSRWCLAVEPSAAFYLLPSRIFEFCLGAMMVWLVGFRVPGWLKEVALAIGLSLILYAAVIFDPQTPFPGAAALVPCLGACLTIFGGTSRFLGAPLRCKPVVFIGLISYSLYLCHWPMYVFYRYVTDAGPLQTLDTLLLTVCSLVVATLMYRFVERPFRFSRPGPQAVLDSTRFALGCTMVVIGLAYVSASSWANGGWFWRLGDSEDIAEVFDLDRLRVETMDYNRENLIGATFTSTDKRILVVGDSHARDVSNGLQLALAGRGFNVRLQGLDDSCLHQINISELEEDNFPSQGSGGCKWKILSYVNSYKAQHADIIIYSAAITDKTAPFLKNFVQLAEHVNKNKKLQIVLMDRAVNFGGFHARAIKQYAQNVPNAEINQLAFEVDKAAFFKDSIVADLFVAGVDENVLVVSKRGLQCEASSCEFLTNEGDLAVWDRTHWTLVGARTFMAKFVSEYPALFK